MSGQMKWHRAKLQGLPTRSLQDEHEHRSKDAAARWLAKQDVKTARWWRGIIHFTHLAREGGAHASHHRTAQIDGRARRRGRDVAARGARAAGGAEACQRKRNCAE